MHHETHNASALKGFSETVNEKALLCCAYRRLTNAVILPYGQHFGLNLRMLTRCQAWNGYGINMWINH